MGSIQSNDSWVAERYIGGDVTNPHVWAVTVLARVQWVDTGSSGSIRTLFDVYAGDHFEWNIVQRPWEAENTGIRAGNYQGGQAGIIPVAEDLPTWPESAVVPTAPGSTRWVRLVISCDGAVAPGTDWSGNIRFRWLVDGESTVYELTPLASSDVRLVTAYLRAHPDILYSEFRVYLAALTSSEIVEINNSRTSPTALAGVRPAHWPLADVATGANDISGNSRSLTVTGTGVDAADEPLFSADSAPPGIEATVSGEGTVAAEVRQIHRISATVAGEGSVSAAFSTSIGAPLSDQTVFLSGHSLTDQVGVPLELIADGEGEDHDWGEHMKLGSAVSLRSAGIVNPYEDDSWLGYRTGYNRTLPDSSRPPDTVDLVAHFRNVTAVGGKETSSQYTALLLAEGHHLYRALLYNLSVPLHRHYYELIREGSPSCVGYLYSTWLSYVTPMTRTGSGPDIVCRRDVGSAETLFIEIQTSGARGVATFRWSLDGGSTWEAENVTTAEWLELPGRGVIGIENTADLVSGATYSHTWDVAPSYWTAHMREQNAATASIASRINISLAAESRSDRLIVAPVALGLANLIDAATTGDGLDGITEFDGLDIDYQSTLDVIFADAVHPTDVLGKYFLALVCYSTVYRRDCRGVGRPSGVTETQATSLQNVAWDTVVEYFGGRPLGEQFDQSTLKTTFVAHLDKALKINAETSQLSSLTSWFSGTESDLHHNAGTDAALWLDPPPGASADVAGEVVGVGSVSAVVTQGHRIAASVGSEGLVSAAVQQVHRITAAVAGNGAVAAAARVVSGLVATVTGIGGVVASTRQAHRLAGSVTGDGAVSASVRQTHRASGAVTGVGNVSANVSLPGDVAGEVVGVGVVSAVVRQVHRIAAAVSSVGTVAAEATVEAAGITAAVRGTGVVAAILRQTHRIAAIVTGRGRVAAATVGAELLRAPTARRMTFGAARGGRTMRFS